MENKNRKLPRLKNYNYSESGTYFVTICIKDMRCVLSEIVGSGDLDDPFIWNKCVARAEGRQIWGIRHQRAGARHWRKHDGG